MINLRWIADTHATLDFLERHLPVNPPGGHYTEGDIMLENIGILNWLHDDGELVFEPRLRDNVANVERRIRLRSTVIGLGFEPPAELLYEDEGYDCD